MDKNFKRMLSDRLGMFVHFGLYSALGGRYKGETVDGLGEWIQRRAEIPISEYEAFARENFKPDADFARNLVRKAKAAGIKYIVLTSKHHDGFCLFKSEADSYNSYELFGRDLCLELAEACRDAGLELGFYYSHCLDWHERNAGGNYTLTHPDVNIKNRNYWDYPDDNIDFSEYFRRKCLPQVRELLTNYGDLKCIWFDYPHDITAEESLELRELVKSIQPNCLINSRIGHGLCDYYSLGDNCLPATPTRVPTECLITLNETWGYKSDDLNYKSSDSVINILCRALAANATLLVNVGPRCDGSLTPETEEILFRLGEWTRRNAEAIYGGLSGNPFKTVFPWGAVNVSGDKLYLYLKENRGSVSISGVNSRPTCVKMLGDTRRVEFIYKDSTLTVKTLPTEMKAPVYCVEFTESPRLSDKIELDSTRESLPVAFASVAKKSAPDILAPILFEYDVERGDFGKHGLALTRVETAHHWESSDDMLVWGVDFLECGEYAAEVICVTPSFETYCAAPESDVAYTLSVDGEENAVESGVKYSYGIGGTGESNLRYVKSAGRFKIDKCGTRQVTLAKNSEELGYGVLEARFIKQ